MNHMQSYDVHQSHMAAAPTHAASSGPPPAMNHYPQYQQSSVLPSGPPTYPSSQGSYGQYPYGSSMPPVSTAHSVSSSMGSALVPGGLPLPGAAGAAGLTGSQSYPHTFDTTGQIAPPGMKPRVTATLWEDEGSLCFQVEAKGVCVARREDNHMINGTKLLNVAGMTRGRRDGILKSEKTRHVVKIGPMHLKGVWIPFDRALDFANKEKITEQLYPLFVHDIGALLYHPSNSQTRAGVGAGAGAIAAVTDRRRQDQRYVGAPQTTQPPSLHHHHSMSNPVGAHVAQPPHSIAPHPSSGRPGLDRAHTFPTPPTSASSIMGMGNQGSSYEWNGAQVPNVQSNPQLSIDTGLSNARSVPTTPATTPPGAMQNMQYQTSQAYDGSRQMYSAAPAQSAQYPTPMTMPRYGQPLQPSPYPKTDMAPPARAADGETQGDVKPHDGLVNHQTNSQTSHGHEDEADHEQDSEYTHSAPYNGSRSAYGYHPNAPTGALHNEHAHLSPEMTGSPHQNGSGRATPRTTATPGAQWSTGYSTPQRHQQPPSSNLYNVMSENRSATTNGTAPSDNYAAPPVQAAYPSQSYGATNGLPPHNKRVREVEDDDDAYGRGSDEIDGLKRRKTIREGSAGINSFDGDRALQRTKSAVTQRRR